MLLSDLFEASVRPDYLYHGTNAMSALRIIESDRLDARTSQTRRNLMIHGGDKTTGGQQVTGVSMSRSRDFARTWGQDVVFVFDQRRLRQRFRLVPIDFMSHHHGAHPERRREESEEFVLTDTGIAPLSRFLVRIEIDASVFYDLRDDGDYEMLFDHPLVELTQ
jgi:hypothetical protein